MNIGDEAAEIMGTEKLRLATELSLAMRGKTTSECLDVLMYYMPKITAGKKLTAREKGIVIEALKENMNESERAKLFQILAAMEAAGIGF